jgi:hypothetical protein
MNLDQFFFTESSDTIVSVTLGVDSFEVNTSINALGGDDKIVVESSLVTNEDSAPPSLTVALGATLDGGLGSNEIDIFASKDDFLQGFRVGLAINGIIKRFNSLFVSADLGIANNGTVDLGSGPRVRNSTQVTPSQVNIRAFGGFGYGIANGFNGKISLPPNEKRSIFLSGVSSGSSTGLANSGIISTGSGADSITGISARGIGLQNSKTNFGGSLSTGAANDVILANSVFNTGTVNMGLGNDRLRIRSGPGYSVANIIRGDGRFDLGPGNDQFTFGGVVSQTFVGNEQIGKVSGGIGSDTVVISEGQFRFSRLSGSTYRVFDANNKVVADIDGFEFVQPASGQAPIAIRDGIF